MAPQSWPSAIDYVAAVQDPEICVISDRLSGAQFKMNMMGIPVVKSGQTAAVFPVTMGDAGQTLRLFTTPTQHAERYRALSKHLEEQPSPLFVGAEWIEEAIAYGTGRFPAVLMPWVPGKTLSAALDDATEERDTEAIAAMADTWLATADGLAESGIVHGDLQHGNIMVGPDGNFALIDYDGVWLEGLPLSMMEVGHPNYQHPGRLESDTVTKSADVFPGFVIYVSLRALSAEPKLWDEFHSGENLIFSQEDFVGVDKADRTIWSRLRELDDETAALAETLKAACRVMPDSFPSVREMAEKKEGSFAGATKYIVDRSSRSTAGSWWGADDGPGTPEPSAIADQGVPAMTPAPVAPGTPVPAPAQSPAATPAPAITTNPVPSRPQEPTSSSGDKKLRALAIISFLLGVIVMTIAVVLLISGS